MAETRVALRQRPRVEGDRQDEILRATVEVNDRVLFDPEDKAEVEVSGEIYVVMRERDVHAVAAMRVEPDATGLYL